MYQLNMSRLRAPRNVAIRPHSELIGVSRVKSILLTNDDGIDAEGLKILRGELCKIAHVLVVAPDRERSAVSHGLTIRSRLELKDAGPDSFALSGTPADCVIYALDKLFLNPPDMVISGINHGSNLGDDIMYSGTVGAAREAARYGIPAIAVSQYYEDEKKIRFNGGGEFIRNMVNDMLNNGLDGEFLLNVNIPVGKIKGVKITRQGYSEHLKHFNNPDGEYYFTSDFFKNKFISDKQAILDGYVSITPLEREQTDYAAAMMLTKVFA